MRSALFQWVMCLWQSFVVGTNNHHQHNTRIVDDVVVFGPARLTASGFSIKESAGPTGPAAAGMEVVMYLVQDHASFS